MKKNKIFLYTDGGSRGNPGSAAIGLVVCDENKNIIHEYKECIGEATNNEAEYIALKKGLEIVAGICRDEIYCFSDSELLVKQLNGNYRIKALNLRDIYYKIKERENLFKEITYNHLSRDNIIIQKCDELVNHALDDK